MRVMGGGLLLLAVPVLTLLAFPPAAAESTQISDFYVLERHAGGFGPWKWRRDDIYALMPDGRRTYIGTAPASDFTPYAIADIAGDFPSREIAVSTDGRNIVFSHWALHAPKRAGLGIGVYRYTLGGTVELTGITARNRVRWPKPLPPNLMPFSSAAPGTFAIQGVPAVMITWALRADDFAEFPLALLDSQPLHERAIVGDTPAVESQVANGVNVNAQSYWGFTALDLAIIMGHEQTAMRLLELGAEPKAGMYPALLYAAMLARMDVVKVLIARGSDVNMQDEFGYSALHYAVYAGRRLAGGVGLFFHHVVSPRSIHERNVTTVLVQLLLENGADPTIRNNGGRTPLDEAYDLTPAETVRLLQEWRPPAS